KELWVIERLLLVANAIVGHGSQQCHQTVLFVVGQTQNLNVRVKVVVVEGAKVAAAIVEVHHVQQREIAAIVEVRRGQLHVAQAGRLEGPVHGNALIRLEQIESDPLFRTLLDQWRSSAAGKRYTVDQLRTKIALVRLLEEARQ